MILIILTGAAVRLTGSGLGCPDWPTCFKHAYSTNWTIHSKIEFANRLVTVTSGGGDRWWSSSPPSRAARAVATSRCSPDCSILGVVLDAVLGAYVVYSKLNPVAGVAAPACCRSPWWSSSAILYHRSKYVYGAGARADVRDPHFRTVARLLWIPFVVLLITGTMTTGSGPHAGGSQGQLEARRLPFAFSSAAWVHSIAATLFVGLVAGSADLDLAHLGAGAAADGRAPPGRHLPRPSGDRRHAVPHARPRRSSSNCTSPAPRR